MQCAINFHPTLKKKKKVDRGIKKNRKIPKMFSHFDGAQKKDTRKDGMYTLVVYTLRLPGVLYKHKEFD